MKRLMLKKWSDGHYVTAYEQARAGLSNTQIAKALGVNLVTLKAWLKRKKYLRRAIEKGRSLSLATPDRSFADFVYGRLPQHLQELWDNLNRCDNRSLGVERIEALLENQGKTARQHLFVHALVASSFSKTEAMRVVNVTPRTVRLWIEEDPEFAELVDGIMECKKDFLEAGLMQLVAEGDSAATIFANKTLNRDRGYNDKQEVVVQGGIEHNHHHHIHVVPVQALDQLPFVKRMELLDAIDQHVAEQEAQAESQAIPTTARRVSRKTEDEEA